MIALVAALLMSTAAADSRISGNEAEAIAIAVRIFKSKQGSKFEGHPVYGDLRHIPSSLSALKTASKSRSCQISRPLNEMRQALGGAPFMAGRLLTFSRSIR